MYIDNLWNDNDLASFTKRDRKLYDDLVYKKHLKFFRCSKATTAFVTFLVEKKSRNAASIISQSGRTDPIPRDHPLACHSQIVTINTPARVYNSSCVRLHVEQPTMWKH